MYFTLIRVCIRAMKRVPHLRSRHISITAMNVTPEVPVLVKPSALRPVCTVCIHGYSRGVGHTCSKCSRQRRLTGVIIMGVAVVGLITAVGFGQGYFKSTSSAAVSGMTERTLSSRGLEIIQSRLRATRAFQALKIIVVSWQIVTQVSPRVGT